MENERGISSVCVRAYCSWQRHLRDICVMFIVYMCFVSRSRLPLICQCIQANHLQIDSSIRLLPFFFRFTFPVNSNFYLLLAAAASPPPPMPLCWGGIFQLFPQRVHINECVYYYFFYPILLPQCQTFYFHAFPIHKKRT